ncbi:MAG: UDP-N-acetylglucosamine diphosphorylase/glucosamine-1-phosphate N-acetyltransferase [Saprospiraceae bacterium]|jgi:UDP-N-acetylglucosamine diphosphorylase/glucosamine-1-phosphate N-acetyltransferase
MNYILVDTNKKNFLPLTYTRPVSDLRIGIYKISEKWEKLLGAKTSCLTESYLSAKYPTKYSDKNIFINSKFLPTPRLIEQISTLDKNQKLIHGNDWVAVCSSENELNISSSQSAFPADTDTIIEHWWDLFKYNGAEIENDIQNSAMLNLSFLNENIYIIGDEDKLYLHPNAKVDGVSFNTTQGSIYVGENTEIMEGALIRGPFALLPHSTVKMGAKIYGGTTVGPYSKVGGEIKNTVIQGYSNKAHEGYLGNSVLGQWVNLGADTNSSNLKNTFSTVNVWDYQTKKLEHTNETFIGCCIGDYSKTGINTMINTGTCIGVNSNIFGEGFPPKFVPNFSWGHDNKVKYEITKALEASNRMAYFTGVKLSKADQEILTYLSKRRE